MDLSLFLTRELARLRTEELVFNRVLDKDANYEVSFKAEVKKMKEVNLYLQSYLMIVLNDFDWFSQTWRKEFNYGEILYKR